MSNPPADDLVWATAAMRNATSWIHIDAQGFATAIDNVTGTKYWVVCRQRYGQSGHAGDMSSMFWMGTTQVDEAATQCFEHEGVILQPGSVF